MTGRFVHEALIELDDGADSSAPGAAITVALCGTWEHDGPCPLAPHHTSVGPVEGGLGLRTVFACRTGDEPEVRHLLVQALRSGRLTGPDGRTSTWTVLTEGPSEVARDELELAWRLAQT